MSGILSDQSLQGEVGRHGLQFGMCLSPPASDAFISRRAILWEHVEGCRPLCVVMSPTHSRLLDLLNGTPSVCVSRQQTVHESRLKAWRSIRGVHTQRLPPVARSGAGAGVTEHLVAAGHDSATTCDEDATEVRTKSCSRAANSGSADACPNATSLCDEPDQRQTGKLLSLWQQLTTCQVKMDGVAFLVVRVPQCRPVSDVCSESRPPRKHHLNTSSPARTRDATNLGGCPKLRMPCVRSCYIPSCGTTIIPV